METRDLRHFGTHMVWTEEPDLMHVRFVGHIEGHDLRGILDYRGEWLAGRSGYFFGLVDLGNVTGVDASSRKVMTEDRAFVGPREIIIAYGASFAVRVVSEMVVRAKRALRPGMAAEQHFVATEADARALVAKRRREIAAAQGRAGA